MLHIVVPKCKTQINFLNTSQMKITNKDKEIILQKVKEIPSVFWLPKEFTKNQFSHWLNVTQFYNAIHDELETYFSGEESPLRTETQIDYVTTMVILRTNAYITFYSLSRYLWRIIQSTIKNTDISNYDPYWSQAINTIENSDSPGVLLAKILELDCKSEFERCLFYNNFSPRNTYKYIQEGERYNRTRGDSSKKTLLQNQKFEKDLQQKIKKHPGFFIVSICTRICINYLDKHKDERLKDYFQAHQKSFSRLIAHQKSFYHPNKKQRPHEWNKGRISFS